MPTCPNGHQSGSDDWCEVCGHRMAGAVPPPPPPPPAAPGYGYPPPPGPGQDPGYGYPPPSPGPGQDPGYGYPQQAPGRPHLSAVPDQPAEPQLCPQCRTPREANAPFCEECRWNFLTNTATSYTPAAPHPPASNPAQQFQQPQQPQQPHGTQPGQDPFGYQGSRPSQMNRPAEPIPPFGNGNPSSGQAPPPPSPYGNGNPPGQVPPPYSGGEQSGPPQGFQQQAPPAFPQETGTPPPPHQPGPGQPGPGGPAFGGGDDDWVISPPSSAAPGPGAPGGAPQAPEQGEWVRQPQPGQPPQQTQAPQSPPGFQAVPGPGTGTVSWSATIGPDREYFMAMMHRSGPEASGLNLPAYSPEQQRPLAGNQITIGRRRHSTGDTPDIDLSVPPEDPGVSHQHAVLVQQPDGTWAVVDQNSTNGTTVNNGEEPIQPFVPVPLQDGDRVHVGAWTTITIRHS
ncbi:FHA domain-containing protein [Streptomyces sp. NPDC056486]|uniref:FHA domain-containing protein n=1 Tax=Streptomyces sp. NPDC056486 TaxID=3345835 RepID=UPI0036B071CD